MSTDHIVWFDEENPVSIYREKHLIQARRSEARRLEAAQKEAKAHTIERENAEVRDRDLCKCNPPRAGGRVYFGRPVCLLCSGLLRVRNQGQP